MLTDKLQDIFKSIEKSYGNEESQLSVLLGELDTIRALATDLSEPKVIEEIESWEDSDSFEFYWLYIAGLKSVSVKLEAYLNAKNLPQQLYAAIALANENQPNAISKLEELKANNDANIEAFGFNGVKDENDLFFRIKEQGSD
ncbi:MAG: hypothetical protein COA42_05170 [Alteromonadaceae bacterium]|nr:MAG: hypothetical protein COA42_05170 [Alteromonadaceae bacterium]